MTNDKIRYVDPNKHLKEQSANKSRKAELTEMADLIKSHKSPKDSKTYNSLVLKFIRMSFFIGFFDMDKILAEVDSSDKGQMQFLSAIIVKILEENLHGFPLTMMVQTLDYGSLVALLSDYGGEFQSRYLPYLSTTILEKLEVGDLSNLIMIYSGTYFGSIVREVLRQKP